IVNDETRQIPASFHLEQVQVTCGKDQLPTATVTILTPDGQELTDAAVGTGPVDAVYKAINRLVDIPNRLIEFSVQSVTAGIDAIGEVTIRLRHEGRVFSGHSANTDIVVASAYAYLNALNRLYFALNGPQRNTAQLEAAAEKI
ncbi:MAG: alpha-isopropylmalate synthase regulatory domain-containing protein, partial [Cyanobacteria bacterium J06648_11]